MKKQVKFIICGLLAGIPNGFFGSGGGMILVPLFCRWCTLSDRKAFATSVAVVLPMCVVSSVVYFLNHDLSFSYSFPFVAGGFMGGVLSGFLFKKIPTGLLHKILGIFIIYGGVRSLFF